MAEKNCFDMTKLIIQIMCVTVVQWSRSCLHVQINRFDSMRRYFIPFFFLSGLFFNTFFPSGFFFLSSCCWPCWSRTWINIYFKLKSGVLFRKRDFRKLLICIPAKKNISCQDMSFFWNSWIFFNISWLMTNHTHYTTNCTNLSPTPTSDPLAKVKLAFCTSS